MTGSVVRTVSAASDALSACSGVVGAMARSFEVCSGVVGAMPRAFEVCSGVVVATARALKMRSDVVVATPIAGSSRPLPPSATLCDVVAMSSDVREGDVLAAKYRVEKVLGQGGMGVVVAASHVQLGHKVALKFLLPGAAQKGDLVQRFLREAKAAVSIQSEHVARVLDVGQLDSGAPYMVMEYLQGHDLAAELRERGPLPIERAVDYVLQAGEALAEAHERGMVHRDLKPANLFITRRADGSALIKVLDFGIAKVIDATSPEALTKTTAVMGSPLYMSPEQVRSSKAVDARSDIWSLGVLLQELITGRPSFDAETVSALMAMIAADPPTLLRAARPDAPEGLERAISRALAKRLEDRTPNMAALATDLAPFASARGKMSVERIVDTMRGTAATALRSRPPPRAVPVAAAESAPMPLGQQTDASWAQTGVPTRRGRGRLVGAVAATVAVLVGVSGWWIFRTRPEKPPVGAPAVIAAEEATTPSASAVSPVVAPVAPAVTSSETAPVASTGRPALAASASVAKPVNRVVAPAPAAPAGTDPLKAATGSRK